jgi:hypothetical protein
MKVTGTAPTENEILNYYGRLLYDSEKFSTVMITSMTSSAEEGMSFSMELSL